MIAARPTGPAPTTATTSPGLIRPLRTPISKPVGRMSESITAASSLTPSGSLCSESSANGTRTYSAWVPSIRWPKIQPMPEVPSPSRQCAGSCWWQ